MKDRMKCITISTCVWLKWGQPEACCCDEDSWTVFLRRHAGYTARMKATDNRDHLTFRKK